MRKSLQGLDPRFIRETGSYPGLPEELRKYCYYIADSGYSIMAVPEKLQEANDGDTEPRQYEIPVPVKYVLDKGYTVQGDYVIVPADYDSAYGLDVDISYYE